MKRKLRSVLAASLAAVMAIVQIPAVNQVQAMEKAAYTEGERQVEENGYSVKTESEGKYAMQTASGRDEAYVQELDGTWQFGGQNLGESAALSADRSNWQNVTVPHTWNAIDADDGGGNYLRTKYWYHKAFSVTDAMMGKRIYIEFLACSTKTDVYVNGKRAGETHKGGYTTFRYDITDKVKSGSNTLDVCVDNTYDQEIAPISGDFNIYGGINKRVFLVAVDDVHVDLEHYGSSGLFLETGNMRSETAPKDLGEFDVKAKLVNSSNTAREVTVTATVEGDNAPAPIEKTVSIPANGSVDFSEHCKVENPTLWEGVRYDKTSDNKNVGYQYTVSLEIKEGSQVIDKVQDKIGFRYFWIDSKENGESGEGFFLNGKKYPLRGVNRHSFMAGVGSALTEDQHEADMEIMKELGVNTVRLCHYPHTDYFYDLCDDNGIIVWTEIPVVNEVRDTDGFKNVTKQQLTELISQQYNRPSVVFWGLENEIGNGQSLTDAKANVNLAAAKKIVNELDTLTKQLDRTGRYTTQALNRDYGMNQNKPDSVDKDFETNVGWKSDVVAWNIYPGWYPDANFYGTFEDVMKRKTALDSRSMGISEYGWGANVSQHEAEPELGKNNLTAGGAWHPEEYQNLMNEEAIDYLNTHDELWGTFYWALFDFAVDSRNEGGQPALNDKGLVTADRKTKKDSFYLYKANWNKRDSFTYITSQRWTNRESSKTDIKVYSNCDEVELFVNGSSKGKMEPKGNGVFLLRDVPLDPGDIVVKSVGTNNGGTDSYEDTCTWKRELSKKPDLTSEEFAVDTAEKTIALDNNVTLAVFKEKVSGVNNAVYTVYDGDQEVTDDNTLIVPGMRIHVVAEDQKTEADYTVVTSNLCLNKTVTVSSFETGNIGENAVDGNSATKWTAVNGTYPQSIVVDLGKTYNLGDLTLDWDIREGKRYYRYIVSASQDGKEYVEVINRRDNTESKRMVESMHLIPARYIKIEVTGCNQAGWATLFEIKADGYRLTSGKYNIDEEKRLIVVDEIPTSGLADSTFSSNLVLEGNYEMRMNYSSGWIHEGNTVDILDRDKKIIDTYTICTDSTKDQYAAKKDAEYVLLNTVSCTMSVGATRQLKATVLPTAASDKTVTYTSSDKDIVSVSADGVMTAAKGGTATITAKTANGKTASCNVEVKDYSNVSPVVYLPLDKADEVNLFGKAAVVQDPDNASNHALLVDETGGGKNGNYAIAKQDLSKFDFSEGVTVSLNVRPNANSSDWNYLFALGKTKSSGSFMYCDGTIGFIARHGDPYEAHFPGDGWADGNPVNSDYNYFGNAANAGKWYRLTYVYARSELCLYVNGILTCRWGEGLIGDVLKVLNEGHLVLGAGASEGEYENFGGYIDDVYIYDQALDSAAVNLIGTKKPDDKPGDNQPGDNKPGDNRPGDNKPGDNQPGGNQPDNNTQKDYTVNGITYEIKSASSVIYKSSNKNATSVTVPNTVKVNGKTYKVVGIAANACKNNKKLTKVTIGNNVSQIGANAFSNCSKLKTIVIKSKKLTAKNVGSNVFKGIDPKARLTVPAEKKKLYMALFMNVGKSYVVKGVTYEIKSTSSVIYKKSKKNAASVTVPGTVKIEGKTYQVVSIAANACKNNKKLKKVTIGKNVTEIGRNAFSGCTKLNKLSMGNSVKTIGEQAFYNCASLTKVTVPASTAKIGKQAFYKCRKLKTVVIKSKKLTAKSVGKNVFKSVSPKAKITVPKGKKKSYQKLF